MGFLLHGHVEGRVGWAGDTDLLHVLPPPGGVWRAADVLAGDVYANFTDVCLEYCSRELAGTLDLLPATGADVATLSCLTSIGGDLRILRNPALTTLAGLDCSDTIGGGPIVIEDDGLTPLAGLDARTHLGINLNIADNPQLCDAEVDDLIARLVAWTGTAFRSGNTGPC